MGGLFWLVSVVTGVERVEGGLMVELWWIGCKTPQDEVLPSRRKPWPKAMGFLVTFFVSLLLLSLSFSSICFQ